MANTSTASRKKVVGTFDTTGSSDSIIVGAGQLADLSLDFDTNSFVGTIDLERETNTGAANIAEWQVMASYTASAEKVIQSSTRRRYRLTASTVTSGTAEFELTAGITI